jgi:hypothetical protein
MYITVAHRIHPFGGLQIALLLVYGGHDIQYRILRCDVTSAPSCIHEMT